MKFPPWETRKSARRRLLSLKPVSKLTVGSLDTDLQHEGRRRGVFRVSTEIICEPGHKEIHTVYSNTYYLSEICVVVAFVRRRRLSQTGWAYLGQMTLIWMRSDTGRPVFRMCVEIKSNIGYNISPSLCGWLCKPFIIHWRTYTIVYCRL